MLTVHVVNDVHTFISSSSGRISRVEIDSGCTGGSVTRGLCVHIFSFDCTVFTSCYDDIVSWLLVG